MFGCRLQCFGSVLSSCESFLAAPPNEPLQMPSLQKPAWRLDCLALSKPEQMRFLFPILSCLVLLGCGRNTPATPQGRLDEAVQNLDKASTEIGRFYALRNAAKESFENGKVEDARKYANELLALAEKFPGDWNYGNAIHDGNV